METCSICQEDINEISNMLITTCSHKFHTNCYIKYIKISEKDCCPMCRCNQTEDSETNLKTDSTPQLMSYLTSQWINPYQSFLTFNLENRNLLNDPNIVRINEMTIRLDDMLQIHQNLNDDDELIDECFREIGKNHKKNIIEDKKEKKKKRK